MNDQELKQFVDFLNDVTVDGKHLPDNLIMDIVTQVKYPGGKINQAQATDGKAEWYTPTSTLITQRDSGFKFGASSERELVGVNVDLVRVTRLALQYSKQDFTVYDGIRTLKEQQQHVKAGNSKTMQSKHLQGLAVDLVPWINGAPKWDWDGCYKIACAMDQAATELGLAHRITWGGAWDRKLSDFGGDVTAYAKEVQAYRNRHQGQDFIDGPHFEILPN